jgi:hypothetical protein
MERAVRFERIHQRLAGNFGSRLHVSVLAGPGRKKGFQPFLLFLEAGPQRLRRRVQTAVVADLVDPDAGESRAVLLFLV